MPADHFKIHVKPGYGTIDDLFVWINASMDISKNKSSGIPDMQQRFDEIRSRIFEEPLWVLQDYFGGYIFNHLFYNIPGQVESHKNIRFICENDKFNEKTGILKIHATETIEDLPCKPMVLTKNFLETYFNRGNTIPYNINFYYGMKLKDFDQSKTNLTIITKGKFALSWMGCMERDVLLGEECDYPFSGEKLGKLKIVEQSIYQKAVCY
ncbi:Oidioi.mRNA.OKI2018_I69.chr2.g6385.t1.cds [Oikopleura dioica]|uniref:Oidioi.mRNA.OKI2018_I69.chr2.g6385.t1.cds n=1 Tax=Oikopleura dioica TaxID=34765 RepID=A0ABN7T9D5_OIKDI|nr:Oidioi.mRNA.OKI2018_I69.chr2.g6385.t1.cds [Oikopleura dioica]